VSLFFPRQPEMAGPGVPVSKRPLGITFFPEDWTQPIHALTPLEFGVLVRLALQSIGSPEPGTLPNDDRKLALRAGLSVEDWATIRPSLFEFMEVAGEAVRFPTIKTRYDKAASFKRQQADHGRKRWGTPNERPSCDPHATHERPSCKPDAFPVPDPVPKDPPTTTREAIGPPDHTEAERIAADRVAYDAAERDFARWAGRPLRSDETRHVAEILLWAEREPPLLLGNGSTKPVASILGFAVAEAVRAGAAYSSAYGAVRYVRAMIQRCRDQQTLPGQWPDRLKITSPNTVQMSPADMARDVAERMARVKAMNAEKFKVKR